MPRFRRFLAGAACALALFASPLPAAEDRSAQTLDRIVAVVDNGVILASELDTEIEQVRRRLRQEDRDLPPPDVLRERVLEELVVERIQLQQAAERGVDVDDAQVREALRNMAGDRGTDLAGLQEQAQSEGMDFDRLRRDVRDQLIVSRLRQRFVASQVQISDSEVDDFLARVERANDQRRQYRLRHILIGLPSDASTEAVAAARERAESAIARLNDGMDFSEMASRISDGPRALEGGDLGWRRPPELPELFADALGGLETGGLAGPLRSANGFHIVKLVDERGGAAESVTETRVRQILLQDGGGAESPHERLVELRRRLENGADFAALARAHSDDGPSASAGGDLGWIGPAELPPAVHEVLDGLPTGQVSEPFQSPAGWHIVEVLDRRERVDAEQHRRSQARQALYRRKLEEETQRWLRELRDGAYVDLRIDG